MTSTTQLSQPKITSRKVGFATARSCQPSSRSGGSSWLARCSAILAGQVPGRAAQAPSRFGSVVREGVGPRRRPGAVQVDDRRRCRPIPVPQAFQRLATTSAARGCETSPSTTADSRRALASCASRRAPTRGSGLARPRRDGSACSTGTRRPYRLGPRSARRSRGTPPGSDASRLGPSRRSGLRRLKGVSVPLRGVVCRSSEMSWSSV